MEELTALPRLLARSKEKDLEKGIYKEKERKDGRRKMGGDVVICRKGDGRSCCWWYVDDLCKHVLADVREAAVSLCPSVCLFVCLSLSLSVCMWPTA